MADNKVVKITFEIDGIKQSVGSVEELQTALKGVEAQAEKTAASASQVGKEISDAGKEMTTAGEAGEGAITVLDEATGGLANQFVQIGKGITDMGKFLVQSFKGGVQGASAMGKALIATGIGAVVVGVGLLVTYWEDIVGLVSGVSSSQKKLLADTEATVAANQANLDATTGSEESLKAQGLSETEIRDLKIQQTNEVITATEAQLEQQKVVAKAQEAAAERNQKILTGILAFLTAPITILLKSVDALTLGLEKIGVIEKSTDLAGGFLKGLESASSLLFDPDETREEGEKTVAETEKQLRALKNQRDGYINQGKAESQKNREEATAKAKEAAAEAAALQAELNQQLEDLRAQNIQDAEKQALALLEIERKRARKELEDKKASTELLAEFDKRYEQQKQEIVDEFAKAAEEKKKEEEAKAAENRAIVNDALRQAGLDSMEDTFQRAQAELEIQRQADIEKITLAGATADEIARINASYTDKSKKLSEEELKFKKALKQQEVAAALNASSAVLGSIVDLVGEGSAVGKAAAVAQATIDTYTSATAAYSSTVGIPIVGPVLAPIAAGVAVAAGLLNVKKILSTKIPGGGGGGGGGSVGGAPPTAPTVPTVPSFDPQAAIAGTVGGAQAPGAVTSQQVGSQTQTIRAYVVDSEVTSQQEATRKIENLASL
jgi:hypothetical protein